MSNDGNAVTEHDSTGSKNPARSTRPRVNGVICIVIAVVFASCAVALFWSAGKQGAILGPASALLAEALVSAVIAALAFRLAGGQSAARPLIKPFQVLTILVVAIGVVGAALGLIFGGISGSTGAIAPAVIGFFASLVPAIQGVLLYGTASHRA